MESVDDDRDGYKDTEFGTRGLMGSEWYMDNNGPISRRISECQHNNQQQSRQLGIWRSSDDDGRGGDMGLEETPWECRMTAWQ